MDPSLTTAVIGGLCASAGSLVTGLVLKSSERRRALRGAGLLEIARKQRVDGYNALRELTRQFAELEHCVWHVEQAPDQVGPDSYVEAGRAIRLAVRRLGRGEQDVFGADLARAITDASDSAGRFFDLVEQGASQDAWHAAREDWANLFGEVHIAARNAERALLFQG